MALLQHLINPEKMESKSYPQVQLFVAECAGQSTSPGATADQDQWYGAASQQWVFTGLGNGQYQIQNVHSSLYLGMTSQETNPGATADQDQ